MLGNIDPEGILLTESTSTKKITDIATVHRYYKILTHEYPFYTAPNGTLWYYDMKSGIWKDDEAETMVRSRVARGLNGSMRYKTRIVNEVINAIKFTSYDPEVKLGGPPEVIVVANGRLNILTGDFTTVHDRREHHITRIPVRYDKDAKCPVFEGFLPQVMNSADDIMAIPEFFGYCLYKGHFMETLMMFLGDGENGKSTLIHVLTALLGDENISASSLQELSTNRFRTAHLFGKLANVSADIPATKLMNTGIIKAITSGDMIDAEKKGQDPFTFSPFVKLMFSANSLPPSMDTSNAFYRRIRIIDFPHTFGIHSGKRDPHLKHKLTTPIELSGVLNLAVEGIQRLAARGYLCGEKTTHEKRMDYIKRSDSVQYFADKYVSKWKTGDDVAGISVSKMYGLYVTVTDHLGLVPLSQLKFSRDIVRYIPYADKEKEKNEDDRILWYWKGCTVDIDEIGGL